MLRHVQRCVMIGALLVVVQCSIFGFIWVISVASPPILERRARAPPQTGTFLDSVRYPLLEQAIVSSARQEYSMHSCVGENFRDDAWISKSCHFRSVCYDGNNKGVMTYYVNEKSSMHWRPGTDDLKVSVSTHGSTNVPIPWVPEIILGPVPPGAKWADDIDNVAVHVLACEYNGSNFGHVLGDMLLPWWRLADLFGFGNDFFRPIHLELDPPFSYSCIWLVAAGRIPDMEHCHRLYAKIADPFTHHPVVYLQKHYSSASPETPICFDNLLVGIGMLADHGHDNTIHGRHPDKLDEHMIGMGPVLWRFRNLYMERVGMNPMVRPIDGTNDIVFLDRSAVHRRWYDSRPTIDRLRERYARDHVAIRGPVDFKDLSINEQIAIVSTTKVLVAFPGGATYIDLFLPRGATIVFVWASDNNSGMRQDFPLHNNMAHISTIWVQGEWQASYGGEVKVDHAVLCEKIAFALHKYRAMQGP